MKPMSQRRYRKGGGGCCPFCLSGNLDCGSVDIDGPEARQEVSCNDCDKEWTDTYELVKYTETA